MSKKLIMGISDMADPSVSIVQNGKIAFYIEEERLTRIKHSHNQFPINSIKLALKNLNIKTGNVYDALQVMKMVEKIYRADKKWRL